MLKMAAALVLFAFSAYAEDITDVNKVRIGPLSGELKPTFITAQVKVRC